MLNRILADSRRALVRDLHQKLGEVRVALVRAGAAEEQQKALGRAISQLDDLFLLVVVGEFNAGKSAVVNALVGERVVEEGVTPTTSRVQLLRHGEARTRTPVGGDYEELTLPVAILREMNVVDTPGTNAVMRGHEALTREFVPRSDLVLFVTSADRPFTETERTFLAAIRDWGKKVVVAVNKTDILETPEDVRKVVEFVRDKLRELLGLRLEVFPVSAREAWKARAGGAAPDRAGFSALEAYLTRTLDEPERLRVKLESPLGVAERALHDTTFAVEARLAAASADEAALKEIDALVAQHGQDLTRELRLRVAEAERPVVELERRGQDFLAERLRLPSVLKLLSADATAAEFRQEVAGGIQAAVDKRAEGLVDALVTAEGRLWPALMERLERRRGAHAQFPAVKAPAPDRARPLQALSRDCHRALEDYDAEREAARLAKAARRAASATLLLPAAAIVLGALALTRTADTANAVVGLTLALALAFTGLAPLSLRRGRERERLAEAAGALRQRLASALRSGFERELDGSQKRVQEAVAPFGRFVRFEGERLRGLKQELDARRKDVDALRARVAALR